MRDAKDCGSSPDPLVQIAWLIHGLDLHHRTGGLHGYTLEKTVEYVTSSILKYEHRVTGGCADCPHNPLGEGWQFSQPDAKKL